MKIRIYPVSSQCFVLLSTRRHIPYLPMNLIHPTTKSKGFKRTIEHTRPSNNHHSSQFIRKEYYHLQGQDEQENVISVVEMKEQVAENISECPTTIMTSESHKFALGFKSLKRDLILDQRRRLIRKRNLSERYAAIIKKLYRLYFNTDSAPNLLY